jgi:hypothetical protein
MKAVTLVVGLDADASGHTREGYLAGTLARPGVPGFAREKSLALPPN